MAPSIADEIWNMQLPAAVSPIDAALDKAHGQYSADERLVLRNLTLSHLCGDPHFSSLIQREAMAQHPEICARLNGSARSFAHSIPLGESFTLPAQKDAFAVNFDFKTAASADVEITAAPASLPPPPPSPPAAAAPAEKKLTPLEMRQAAVLFMYEDITTSPTLTHLHSTVDALWKKMLPVSYEENRKAFAVMAILSAETTNSAMHHIRDVFKLTKSDAEVLRDTIAALNDVSDVLGDQKASLRKKGILFMEGSFFLPAAGLTKDVKYKALMEQIPQNLEPVADAIIGYYTNKTRVSGDVQMSVSLTRALLQSLRPESAAQLSDFKQELQSALNYDRPLTIPRFEETLEKFYKIAGVEFTAPSCINAVVEEKNAVIAAATAAATQAEEEQEQAEPEANTQPGTPSLPARTKSYLQEEFESPAITTRRELEQMVKAEEIVQEDALIYFLGQCAERARTPTELAKQFKKSVKVIGVITENISKKLSERRREMESDGDLHEDSALRP